MAVLAYIVAALLLVSAAILGVTAREDVAAASARWSACAASQPRLPGLLQMPDQLRRLCGSPEPGWDVLRLAMAANAAGMALLFLLVGGTHRRTGDVAAGLERVEALLRRAEDRAAASARVEAHGAAASTAAELPEQEVARRKAEIMAAGRMRGLAIPEHDAEMEAREAVRRGAASGRAGGDLPRRA